MLEGDKCDGKKKKKNRARGMWNVCLREPGVLIFIF